MEQALAEKSFSCRHSCPMCQRSWVHTADLLRGSRQFGWCFLLRTATCGDCLKEIAGEYSKIIATPVRILEDLASD